MKRETDFKENENYTASGVIERGYKIYDEWKNKKYSFVLIKAACEIAMQSNNKSIRYIDTIIFEENKKEEIGELEYQKRQQETIELSKIDWLNK